MLLLTQFGEIEGMDIKHELFRERGKAVRPRADVWRKGTRTKTGEKSEFEKVIDRAVEIAFHSL